MLRNQKFKLKMASSSFRVFKACKPMLAAAKTAASTPPSVATISPKLPKQNGLTKPLKVSPALSKFVGAPKASRGEIMKKIWEHIKLNNLQNPTDRRQIICDAKLKTLFPEKDTIGMLEIAKFISPHFIKDN